MQFTDYKQEVSAQVALDAAADAFVFTPGVPVDVVRVGVIVSSATTTNPQNLDIEFDKRPTAGSDTGRTTSQATIIGTTGLTQGKMHYKNLSTPLQLNPGEQLVAQVVNAMTAGDGHIVIEYQQRPFQSGSSASASDRLANATESA